MLQRAVTFSRYVVFVAVVAALAGAVALILYEAAVVGDVIFNAIKEGFSFNREEPLPSD